MCIGMSCFLLGDQYFLFYLPLQKRRPKSWGVVPAILEAISILTSLEGVWLKARDGVDFSFWLILVLFVLFLQLSVMVSCSCIFILFYECSPLCACCFS